MLENMFIPVLILGGLGAVFGVGLSFASKKFAVEVDERIEPVRNALPGANCAACASADVTLLPRLSLPEMRHRTDARWGSCRGGSNAEIMGVEAVEKAPKPQG